MPELKTVIVTGAAQGLGKAVVKAFYHEGWRVALLDVDTQGISKLQEELGEGAQCYPVDLTDAGDTQAVTGTARDARLQSLAGGTKRRRTSGFFTYSSSLARDEKPGWRYYLRLVALGHRRVYR